MYNKFIVRIFSGNQIKLREFGKFLVRDGFAESAHMMQLESFYLYNGKVLDQYIWSLEVMTTEERYASVYTLVVNQFQTEDVRVIVYPVIIADIFKNFREKETASQTVIDADARETAAQ